MPKSDSLKKFVPINELETTPFTDVIEIERTVTPDQEKRVDHILVKRKKICRANPSEIFETEEVSRFDVAWPEEPKDELKEEVSEEQKVDLKLQ
tara:strand:- start:8 stop:289 length:282 start_codon:yes stop_codon:yes gene_type:complete